MRRNADILTFGADNIILPGKLIVELKGYFLDSQLSALTVFNERERQACVPCPAGRGWTGVKKKRNRRHGWRSPDLCRKVFGPLACSAFTDPLGIVRLGSSREIRGTDTDPFPGRDRNPHSPLSSLAHPEEPADLQRKTGPEIRFPRDNGRRPGQVHPVGRILCA